MSCYRYAALFIFGGFVQLIYICTLKQHFVCFDGHYVAITTCVHFIFIRSFSLTELYFKLCNCYWSETVKVKISYLIASNTCVGTYFSSLFGMCCELLSILCYLLAPTCSGLSMLTQKWFISKTLKNSCHMASTPTVPECSQYLQFMHVSLLLAFAFITCIVVFAFAFSQCQVLYFCCLH